MNGRGHGAVAGETEAVYIRMLGGFRISVGDSTIPENAWRLRKAASLVKFLALAHGHRLHREQAMEALWPDLGKKAASNNLRQALYAARRTLGGPDPRVGSRYLASEDETLVLCPEGEPWVDAEAFEEAAKNARRSREPTAYEVALDLYAGELLPGDRYEEWAEEHRRRLRETYLSLLLRLARLHEERGDYETAAEVLRRLVEEEPIREQAHLDLMRLYAQSGRESEALAQYRRLEETLREIGAEPAASSRALKEEIASGRLAAQGTGDPSIPTERPLEVVRHNLPAPRDSFVGREQELSEIKRELAKTRLLTLTGTGGSGKTRLALQVTRGLVGAYPDGVWLVELAGLSEGTLVPQAVAGALGVRERPGQPITDTLNEALRTKQALLVLDNCEHLVETAAHLVDALLDSCPNLRLLATSREALGVAGEVRWAVRSLSVPDAHLAPSVEELEGYESARLFAERASERRPGFAVNPENAEAVAEICRRLEGVPLAIELAAARVGTLSVKEIRDRLENSLKLLTSGGRIQAPRQRTLRGTLDWSHKLLSESEKKIFERLAAFAGGCTLAAAEEVVSGNGVEEGDVLDLLSELLDKSLVLAEAAGEGEARYRMLEPIRQYAREKLEESGEAQAVSCRHAAFFLTLAEESEPGLWGPEEASWLEHLEAEHDNMRAALSWAIEQGDAELGLRLTAALRWFWYARGHFGEGRGWLERALHKDGETSAGVRAKALDAVGWLAHDQGDMDRAVAAAEEGLELNTEEIEGSCVASFRNMLGEAARHRGDYERATELFAEGLALYREAGDTRGIAWSLGNLANVSSDRGDYERAVELYEEGLALCRELGGAQPLGDYLSTLGYEFLLQGNHERAAALNEEAAALLRNQGHKGGLQYALDNLGWTALVRGDHEQAKALHEESLALCRELGDQLVASESMEGLACAAGIRGEAERAARMFGAAQALREAVGYRQAARGRALRKPYLALAISQLDQASWEAAFADGQRMTFEQAVEYVLSAEEFTLPTSPAPQRSSTDESPADLTRREREVASLLSQGLTNRQIASELVISEHTVENHVARILKKLNLRSREQVAARLARLLQRSS